MNEWGECKCGCETPEHVSVNLRFTWERVNLIMQELRDQGLSDVLELVSGYRCPKHNKAVGGAVESQHLLGRAADLKPKGLSVEQLWQAAKAVRGDASPEHPQRSGGIGVYNTFVHVDVREGRANWDRRTQRKR